MEFNGVASLISKFSYTGIISTLIYVGFIALGIWQVNRTINENYRMQAKKLHDFNVYLNAI